jgi:hypothetical protein
VDKEFPYRTMPTKRPLTKRDGFPKRRPVIESNLLS